MSIVTRFELNTESTTVGEGDVKTGRYVSYQGELFLVYVLNSGNLRVRRFVSEEIYIVRGGVVSFDTIQSGDNVYIYFIGVTRRLQLGLLHLSTMTMTPVALPGVYVGDTVSCTNTDGRYLVAVSDETLGQTTILSSTTFDLSTDIQPLSLVDFIQVQVRPTSKTNGPLNASGVSVLDGIVYGLEINRGAVWL